MGKNRFNNIKRKAILLISSFLILSSFQGGSEAKGFVDMPNDWSRGALEKAVENELIQGSGGRIRPRDPLTRAEMAAIINRAFAVEKMADLDGFTDLDKEAWYYDEMAKAVAMGTFKGEGDKLHPNKHISRQEAFVVVARALNLEGITWRPGEIRDLNQISTWARGGVFAMLYEDYIQGSDLQLNPRANISRAEFASLMDNVIKNYIREPGEIIGNLEGNVLVTSPGVRIKDSVINGDIILSEALGDGKLELLNTASGRIVIRTGDFYSLDINGQFSEIIVATEKVKEELNASYMIPLPNLPAGVKYLGKESYNGVTSYKYSYNHPITGGGRIESVTARESKYGNTVSITGKDKNGRSFLGSVSPRDRHTINYTTFGPKPEFTGEGLGEVIGLGVLFGDNRNW